MGQDRKTFLQHAGAAALLTGLPGFVSAMDKSIALDQNDFMGEVAPDDEKYWKKIAKKYYSVSSTYINLENGYYGIQPKPILKAFQENIIKANEEAARFARKEYPALFTGIRKQLATFLQVGEEEIIITRNATEALNIAIQGYPFQSGDEVLLNQLDYFSMIETFRMLEKRGAINVGVTGRSVLSSAILYRVLLSIARCDK